MNNPAKDLLIDELKHIWTYKSLTDEEKIGCLRQYERLLENEDFHLALRDVIERREQLLDWISNLIQADNFTPDKKEQIYLLAIQAGNLQNMLRNWITAQDQIKSEMDKLNLQQEKDNVLKGKSE